MPGSHYCGSETLPARKRYIDLREIVPGLGIRIRENAMNQFRGIE